MSAVNHLFKTAQTAGRRVMIGRIDLDNQLPSVTVVPNLSRGPTFYCTDYIKARVICGCYDRGLYKAHDEIFYKFYNGLVVPNTFSRNLRADTHKPHIFESFLFLGFRRSYENKIHGQVDLFAPVLQELPVPAVVFHENISYILLDRLAVFDDLRRYDILGIAGNSRLVFVDPYEIQPRP